MKWSAVRERARAFLAPSVRDRVDFHASKYMSGGRVWLAVDGREVLSVTDSVFRSPDLFRVGEPTRGQVLYAYSRCPAWPAKSRPSVRTCRCAAGP